MPQGKVKNLPREIELQHLKVVPVLSCAACRVSPLLHRIWRRKTPGRRGRHTSTGGRRCTMTGYGPAWHWGCTPNPHYMQLNPLGKELDEQDCGLVETEAKVRLRIGE